MKYILPYRHITLPHVSLQIAVRFYCAVVGISRNEEEITLDASCTISQVGIYYDLISNVNIFVVDAFPFVVFVFDDKTSWS